MTKKTRVKMKRSHDKSGLSIYLLFCILSGKGEPANLARERYIKKEKKKTQAVRG